MIIGAFVNRTVRNALLYELIIYTTPEKILYHSVTILIFWRQEQDFRAVFDYIRAHKGKLMLPDQDIISGLYGERIIPLDPCRYNMTERLFLFHRQSGDRMDLDYVRQNAVIIHYCGRNKPWKPGYMGELNVFYNEAVSQMSENGHH